MTTKAQIYIPPVCLHFYLVGAYPFRPSVNRSSFPQPSIIYGCSLYFLDIRQDEYLNCMLPAVSGGNGGFLNHHRPHRCFTKLNSLMYYKTRPENSRAKVESSSRRMEMHNAYHLSLSLIYISYTSIRPSIQRRYILFSNQIGLLRSMSAACR
ncbi:unnamed protein product [Ceratitis capitata]|uniref:(Mediterranean fruit fly) hypothetical protein n=1 Tax=Ceratitis capitata TaxID=7213 RepID=A0A811UBM8_CERCA|nr:unnamed protein product [Ceratitis capitata]